MPRLEWIAKTLADRWDHLFRQREDADPYRVQVIVTPATYFDRLRAPFELRYAIDRLPNGFELVRELLAHGKGIAILRVPRTPRVVRESALRLSKTQHDLVEPWLARLIFTEKIPIIDTEALDEAHRASVDPYADARLLLNSRIGMIRFALVDLDGKGIDVSEAAAVDQLNKVIEPLSASYLYHRMNEDWSKRSLRLASALVRMCVLALILQFTLRFSLIF